MGTCKVCTKQYDEHDVKQCYGMFFKEGYCSPTCLTKDFMSKQENKSKPSTMKTALALEMMMKFHEGQKRWDGKDFSVHPIKVVEILRKFGVYDEDIICAGYLHDTMEDTDITEYEIQSQLGTRVLGLVKELTFEDSKKDDSIYYNQIEKLSHDAQLIKIADMLANLTDGTHSKHFIEKRINALKIIFKVKPDETKK